MVLQGHAVYMAFRLIDSARDIEAKLLRGASKVSSTFGEIVATILVSAGHVAVVVDDNYYHLKRTEESRLALDLTPFDPDTEIVRLRAGVTTLTHLQRIGVATSILASMATKKTKPQDIIIYQDKLQLNIPGIEYSSYNRALGFVAGFTTRPFSGKYGLINQCQNFASKFWGQLIAPTDVKEIPRRLKSLPEVVETSRAELIKEATAMKRVHPTMTSLAEHYLKVPIAQ